MAFRVATNVASLNTQRWLGIANAGQSKSLERLSSGYKINKAADDAAGIAIALKLNVKAASISKAVDNGNQALAMLQTAESGIEQIGAILTRLKELATQAASDNTSTDRTQLNTERVSLELEIDKIANNTKYGNTQLLKGVNTLEGAGADIGVDNGIVGIDISGAAGGPNGAEVLYTLAATAGATTTLVLSTAAGTQTVTVTRPSGFDTAVANFTSLGVKVTINAAMTANITQNNGFSVESGTSSFYFQVGTNNDVNDQVSISIANFAKGQGVVTLTQDLTTRTNAAAYLDEIDTAIGGLNTNRAGIGAAQNQIGYHVGNLEAMYENTKAAAATIKDADFAKEMADFTKFQIVTQSSIAMLAQANQLPQQILSLLK